MNKHDELKDWQEKYGFEKPKKRMNIYYSLLAFTKTVILVNSHPTEVGWNMVIKPYKDGYMVEDIVVYPQKVSAAYVSVDLSRYSLWKAMLPDETDQNLFGNGHSHVNMGVYPSVVDESQQHDEILSKKNGFYFFQIWNKKNEVSSFFYDLDNKTYYKSEDINIIIEELGYFIEDSLNLARPATKYYINYEVGEGFESEQIV